MTDYTPTTDEVRLAYTSDWSVLAPELNPDMGFEFDRWLAQHDKEVLDEAVERVDKFLGMWERVGSVNSITAHHIRSAIRGEGEQS